MRWVFTQCISLTLVLAGLRSAAAQTAEATNEQVVSVEREAGAESCPDAAVLSAHIERVRGSKPTGETGPYHVSFTYRAGVFRAAITSTAGTVTGAGTGTRVLRDRGATCAALEQATALTLALLIDSDASEPVETIEEPEPPPAPPAVTPTPQPRPVPPPEHSSVSLSLSLGGAGLFGVVRAAAPVAVADLGIGIDRFRTSLGVLWMPEQTLHFGPGVLRETLLAGAARTCLSAWRGAIWRFDLCTGIYAGLLTVHAEGFTSNDSAEKAWLAVPLGATLSTSSAPFGLELGASALFPLRRNDFAIDNLGVAYASTPVGALLSLRAVGSWLL